MRLRVVGKRHYVSLGLPFVEDFPRDAQRFVREHDLDPVDYSILATHRGRLVGFMRLAVFERGLGQDCGTWVAPRFRRAGLALRLWGRAARLLRPARGQRPTIEATAVTRAGRRLVVAARTAHPELRVVLKRGSVS